MLIAITQLLLTIQWKTNVYIKHGITCVIYVAEGGFGLTSIFSHSPTRMQCGIKLSFKVGLYSNFCVGKCRNWLFYWHIAIDVKCYDEKFSRIYRYHLSTWGNPVLDFTIIYVTNNLTFYLLSLEEKQLKTTQISIYRICNTVCVVLANWTLVVWDNGCWVGYFATCFFK